MSQQEIYPVSIKGELTEPPARGWWLLKWLLALPHYIILVFLCIAFVVVCIIAFFAILFTAKYPRGLFNFNVGVLRWGWRVGFYSYQALGTDKYPPFTLKSVADYPADLEVEYPEKLSRGLVLVKWWLLAIPHYIVVGIFQGGWRWDSAPFMGDWTSAPFTGDWTSAPFMGDWTSAPWSAGSGEGAGLIFVVVIIAAIALLFTGKYHQDIFKFVIGLNRWSYRVAAYAALMTDKYPPFRLWD